MISSKIHQAVAMRHPPVAVLWSDEKPDPAMQFSPGRWGCIMWLITAAAKGKRAVCDRETFGCFGGGVGVGFGNQYLNFPGGEACFCHFLSIGNYSWEQGRKAADKVKPFLRKEAYDHFAHGERYLKSPELVKRFIDKLPITDIPARYVIFKSLFDVLDDENPPKAIIFFADPNELSALTILANYGRGDNENVIMPYAAGCQTACLYPFREAESEKPRAVVGLTDLSARVAVRKQLGDNLMTFAVPFALFQEMEANVEGSFLERGPWKALKGNG
jgi:hypothetical protein